MEFFENLALFLGTYGDKLLAYLGIAGGSIVGGITIWKLGNIIIKLINMAVQKKYANQVNKKFDEFLPIVSGLIEQEFEKQAHIFKESFNQVQDAEQEKRQEIFEKVFNKKQEVEVVKAEIDTVSEEKEEIEQIPQEEEKVEIKAETKTETKKKTTDIL